MSDNNVKAVNPGGTKVRNRYLLLIVAAIVNFPTGAGANWAMFQPAAKARFSLKMGTANMPFSVFMMAFVIGNIIGGKMQQKWSGKAVVIFGNLLMSVGILLMAFVPENMPALLSVTYGIMGGAGAGIGYNAMIATIARWFPDRKGFATGLIVCLVGANGLIMAPIVNSFMNSYGYSKTIIIVAVIYLVILAAGGWMISAPPEGYMADYKPANAVVTTSRDYTASEMVKTKQFYLIAGAMAFGTMAYFLLNPMVKSLGMERGLSEALAVTAIMVLSIGNLAARLIIPTLSDKFGRKAMLMILFVLCIASVLVMMKATGALYLVCAFMIAFVYGGFFGIFPVVAMDQFGPKNAGLNYGIIMIGYGIVVLICPSLVNVGVAFAFVVAAITCVLGMIMMLLLKPTASDK